MEMNRKELGGARLKLIIALVVFVVVVYAGYLYIPVAVDGVYLKDAMQNKVDAAVAQGYDANWVTDQIKKSGPEFHMPEDATITAALKDNRMELRVQYVRPISCPLFTYNYNFDHTANSTAFLTIK